MGSDIWEQKQALRRQVLAARDALDAASAADRSAAICARIMELHAFESAHTAMLFASFGSECSTWELIGRTLEAGKRLVLPAVQGRGRLALRLVTDVQTDLVDGTWGIREPGPQCPAVEVGELDLVLVSGVAFDESGGRLGHGGVYYDCLIRQAIAAPRPPRIVAAGFELQVVDRVPVSAHDCPVPVIVTEDRVILAHPTRQTGGAEL